MPARNENWQLLGHSSDPVAGDPDQLDDLVLYYARIAETIKTEAAVLERIGSGDTTELKGQSADAIRSRSKDVAKSLTQTSGRYDAVAKALSLYAPSLDTARTESLQALREAEAAEGARGSSSAMPDPGADRPEDAPPLTEEENAQIHARSSAMTEAADSSGRAQRRMEGVLSVLDSAGASASGVIRGAWDDGLVDTWQYKLREGFLKFLRVLVKVLMWIGVALAVLAFFIPGLGAAALAGAIVAVASLGATFALAAMGEGSWLDVIIAVVGVIFIGVGAIVAKVVQTAHAAKIAKGAAAAKSGTTGGTVGASVAAKTALATTKRNALFAKGLSTRLGVQSMSRVAALDRRLLTVTSRIRTGAVTDMATKHAIKPQWWNAFTKNYGRNDWNKMKEFGSGGLGQFTPGKYRLDRFLSTDRVGDYRALQTTLQTSFGIAPKAVPWWYYANAGRVVGGLGINIMKWATTPTGFGTDTSRAATSPEYTAAKTALTAPVTPQ